MYNFRVKTKFGGAVSIICVVVMVLLFASEIRMYLTPEVREELVVDTTRTGKLKINIDFVFSRYDSVVQLKAFKCLSFQLP